MCAQREGLQNRKKYNTSNIYTVKHSLILDTPKTVTVTHLYFQQQSKGAGRRRGRRGRVEVEGL